MATRKVLKTTTTKPLPSKEKMEKQIAKIKHESMYSPDGTKYEGGGDKKKIAQWKKLDMIYRNTYKKEIKAENKAKAEKYGKHIQAGENIAAAKEGRKAMHIEGGGNRAQVIKDRAKIDQIGLAAFDQQEKDAAEARRSTFKNRAGSRLLKNNNGQWMH